MARLILDPVQSGTTVVYLIDDTGSQRHLREELKRIFLKLLADHQATADVRVAALVHGDIARPLNSRYTTILWDTERFTLGRGSGGPHMFGSGFKDPKDITPTDVINGINGLTLSAAREYLYPGIALAEKMMIKECPKPTPTPTVTASPIATPTPTPTPTPRPWCQRKVIVILGDGNPGRAHSDYYLYSGSEMPDALMRAVRAADIALHTLCLGTACTNHIHITPGTRAHYDLPTCCARYKGADIMKKLAELSYKGGKHYR